jgi:tetratricopeptide (TPR) repeat protein
MFSNQNFRFQLVLIASAIALLYPWIGCSAFAVGTEEQVCDVSADYALGIEDYSEAIRLHAEVVRKAPENALAHYHLGFAQGEMGNRTAEVTQYRRAEALGLRIWDLFLNLGLAQIENGDLDAATHSLQRAVLLGGEHWESHFDLAVVEERRGMLADAEREALVSLGLNPGQPDVRNLLGVIYAQEGKTVRAYLIWRELVHDVPDYEPARKNLSLLGSQNEVAFGKTAAAALPAPAAAVKAIKNERKSILAVMQNTPESAPVFDDLAAVPSTHLPPEAQILLATQLESYRRLPILLMNLDTSLSRIAASTADR